MDQKTIQGIHEIQLDMLAKLDQVCRENQLRYIAISGTLLGTVRHQGFIPWDDDMDIALVREDYEKLIRILQEKPIPGCFFQEFRTDAHYNQPYAKLLKDNTVFVEEVRKNCKARNGVFIDIFPLDHVKNPYAKVYEVRRILARMITFAIWHKENCYMKRVGLKKLLNPLAAMLSVFPKDTLIAMQKRLVIREHPEWNYVANMFTCNYSVDRLYFSVEDLQEAMQMPFESGTIYVPKDWDGSLKRLYKNYMQLPPEDKRNSGHDVCYISL